MGCGPCAVSKEKCKIVNSKLIAHGCWWRYCRPLGSKLQEFFWRVILGQSLTSLPFATYLISLCSHSNPDNCFIFSVRSAECGAKNQSGIEMADPVLSSLRWPGSKILNSYLNILWVVSGNMVLWWFIDRELYMWSRFVLCTDRGVPRGPRGPRKLKYPNLKCS